MTIELVCAIALSLPSAIGYALINLNPSNRWHQSAEVQAELGFTEKCGWYPIDLKASKTNGALENAWQE